MRILIDAMGGDNAPGEIVRGAVEAAREFDLDVTLIGREEAVTAALADCGVVLPCEHVTLQNAPDVIEMCDDPSTATRKKPESSMAVGLKMLRNGEGDAFVSAGSTGALLSGATLMVRRIRGIRRASFGPVLPNGVKGVLLIDGGANVECTPEYLLQFAYMGSFYAREVMGCENPRIGLLNIGAEESKGTPLQKDTYKLLKEASEAGRLNFVGNVEGRDVMAGTTDVIVADGFSGNIVLKTIEGVAVKFSQELKKVFYKNRRSKVAGAVVREDLEKLKKTFDANEVGGTALLGVSKPVIKAHGSSDAHAIRSAIRQAKVFVEGNVIDSIEKNIEYMRINTNEGE